MKAIKKHIRELNLIFAAEGRAPGGLIFLTVLCIWGYAGPWLMEWLDIPIRVTDALRQNFYIFTKEPMLQGYTYLFLHDIFMKSILVAIIFVWILVRGRNPFRLLGLAEGSGPGWAPYTLVLLAGSAALAWIQGFDPLIPNLPTALFFKESAVIGNTMAVFSIVLVAPVAEEIFFRGYVYPVLAVRIKPLGAIVVTTALFTGIHAFQLADKPEILLDIAVVSLLLTLARAATGSTRYAIFLHASYNAVILTTGFVKYAFKIY